MKLFHVCMLIVTFSCLSRLHAMDKEKAPAKNSSSPASNALDSILGEDTDQIDGDGAATRGRFFGKKKAATADVTAAAATAQGAVNQTEQELKNLGAKAADFEARLQKLEGSARYLKPVLCAGGAFGFVAFCWFAYQLMYHSHSDDVTVDDADEYADDEESQTDDAGRERALAHA